MRADGTLGASIFLPIEHAEQGLLSDDHELLPQTNNTSHMIWEDKKTTVGNVADDVWFVTRCVLHARGVLNRGFHALGTMEVSPQD